jgi:hypothetical protein
MEKELKTILISDLGCATVLVCEGILPIGVEKDKKTPKIYFIFADTPKIASISDKYWAGSHMSNSRTFYENLKMLKNRIYLAKDNAK